MKFGSLQYLWLFVLVPVGIVFFGVTFNLKQRALLKFSENALLQKLILSRSVLKQCIKPILIIAAIIFMILSLIEPKWGITLKEVKRKGVDIVVALDLSKSMLAEDIKPNRLVGAKREITHFINLLRGDRIALVGFSGSAFLYCPLTLDYGTAKLFLDEFDTGSIPVEGTNIGEAIQKSIQAFDGHEKKHRVLILITDGEDHHQTVMSAVEAAKKQGVIIFPIGIGNREGAPIPIFDDKGRKSFIKDREGNIVLTKRDETLLQKIALASGGKTGMFGSGRFPLEDIYENDILVMDQKELKSSVHQHYEHRYQWPLLIAFLLILIESVLDEKKFKKKESSVE
jgi:Ca-activated chloride channel family protein